MASCLIDDLWSEVFGCLPLVQLDVWFEECDPQLFFLAKLHRGAITDAMVHWCFAHGNTQMLQRVSNFSKYRIKHIALDWEPLMPFLLKTNLSSLHDLFRNCTSLPSVSSLRTLLSTSPCMMYSARTIASLALVCDLELFQHLNLVFCQSELFAMIKLDRINENIFVWIRSQFFPDILFDPIYQDTTLQVMDVLVRNNCLSLETQTKLLQTAIQQKEVRYARILMYANLDAALFLSLDTYVLFNVQFLLKHKLLFKEDEQRLNDFYKELSQPRLMNLVDHALRQNFFLVAMKFWEHLSVFNQQFFLVDYNPAHPVSIKCLEFIHGHSNVFADVYGCLSKSLAEGNYKIWKFFQKQQKLPSVKILLGWFSVKRFLETQFIEFILDETTDIVSLLEEAIQCSKVDVVLFLMSRFVVADQSFLKKHILWFCEQNVHNALRMITNRNHLSDTQLQVCFRLGLQHGYMDILAELRRLLPTFHFKSLIFPCSNDMLRFLYANNLTTAQIICRDCTFARTKRELLQFVNGDLDITNDLDPEFVDLLSM